MYPQKVAVLDIETNLAHDHIWMVGLYLPSSGESIACYTLTELHAALKHIHTLIGHNIIGFDLPVLHDVWGMVWQGEVLDTYVMDCLLDPTQRHSLKECAIRAGKELKDDFDPADFNKGLTQDMIDYCLQDCKATWDVYADVSVKLRDAKFSLESIQLEHDVRRHTSVQERNGFLLNWTYACGLYTEHTERMDEIEAQLQEVFPPIITQRFSEKQKDGAGKPKRLKDNVEVFNVGSRQQVAKRLAAKGAVWTRETPTGKPVVDEQSLKHNERIPEAALILEYLTLQKRSGMLKSWLDNTAEDGRIHGRVNTCGAVTGRMTHSSPNLAQIPSDEEYRRCFTVPEGSKLVGVDASGLELRMLAHYMNDSTYTELILNGDIHTYNQEAFQCETRAQAKTLIYAVLYGAGDAKLGSVVGKGEKAGKQIRRNFETSVPAYAKLVEKVKRIAAGGTVPGLDGRRLHIRSEHAALNTLLQSAGAIVMKQALVIATEKLADYGYPYKLVAQVHDELQLEVPDEYAQRVGAVVRNAIRDAGRTLDMRCPLDGEYKIGVNWSETH